MKEQLQLHKMPQLWVRKLRSISSYDVGYVNYISVLDIHLSQPSGNISSSFVHLSNLNFIVFLQLTCEWFISP